jgi:hypothetical protein
MVNDRADDDPAEAEEILASLTEAYVVYGVASWSLLGADGKPLPVTGPNIKAVLLTSLDDAMLVADEADTLYAGKVMRPLMARASKSLRTTPTDGSTSAPTDSSPEPLTPSSPSSTTPTQTDATETTTSPPDGGSSTSPKLVSVA